MAEIPEEMKTGSRHPDPIFTDEERLFRRFRPEDFDGGEVAAEAFELPDMSVNREKYGPPDWLLLDEDFLGWGVAGFRVKDIPRGKEILHLGVIVYVLQAEHVPLRLNYPHSEVRIYRDGNRVWRDNENLRLLEPEFHLRWRERLSRVCRVVIQPSEPE
jgi:hypothetical protein